MKKGLATFSISDENLIRLKKIAEAHGTNINQLICNIVDEYICKHDGCVVCEHRLPKLRALEVTD